MADDRHHQVSPLSQAYVKRSIRSISSFSERGEQPKHFMRFENRLSGA
ncbi:hypothetical protein I656_02361 [Geobacillus sp. WSUCF1]|nr:hypothetical protein I656_02361 [Geobacillus sp. WSUCF1]